MAVQRPVPLKWWGAGMDVLLGVVVFFLFGWMIMHSMTSRYRVYAYEGVSLNAGDIAAYWVLAALILGLQIFGFALGVRHNRKPAMIIYPFLLIGTIGIVLSFALPSYSALISLLR